MSKAVFDIFFGCAESFTGMYEKNVNFKQRLKVWTALMDKYIQSSSLVYDIGCGPGMFSFYTAQQGHRVVGFDGSEGMIAYCEKRKQELELSNIQFQQAEFPFDISSFEKADAIISSSVLEYIEDLDGMLEMYSNALKSGGLLLVSVPNKKSIYRSIEWLSFKTIGQPGYYRFVKQAMTHEALAARAVNHNLKEVEVVHYANRTTFGKLMKSLLGERAGSNLFVSVFRRI